jgi:dTDP-4-amino-4,6-dideoxygalactose transaminase
MVRVVGKDEVYRNNLINLLAQNGIPANVHYKPLPMFTAYKKMGFDINNFKNAYNMYKNEITLPLHTLLDFEDAWYIADTFKRLCR